MARKTSKRLQQLDRATKRGAAAPPSHRAPIDDEPAASWPAFIAGSIAIFILFLAMAVFVGVRSVEGDIEARSEQVLRIAGFRDITAEASGFAVELKGQYPEGQDVDSATQAVASLVGVASVDVSGIWEVEISELADGEVIGEPIAFSWTGPAMTLTGDISTDDQLAFVQAEIAALESEDGTVRFASINAAEVEIIEGLASEDDWIGKIIALVGALAAGLDEGSVTVNPSGEVVTTVGKTETRQEKRDLAVASESFVAALGSVGFDVTDGILGPPKPPPPTREEVEELEQTLAELIEGKVVEFEFNSDELTDVGRALLDDLLIALREFSAVSVEIAGHADAQGTAERNLDLSQRRALAVVAYFVEQGEDPNRFVAVGYGDTRPIADNSTAAGRQKNRRIEFIALEE